MIKDFLERDHARLDQLLDGMGHDLDVKDMGVYGEFRRGLLRHIGMEEKILLPAMQRLCTGEPLAVAAKLRLHHGAIAALLVPTPRRRVLHALKTVLAIHNRVEEGPDGVYAECDRIAEAESETLVSRLRAAPEVPAAVHADGPRIESAARRALERAGFDPLCWTQKGASNSSAGQAFVIPQGVRLTGARSIVGRHRFAPEVPQPSAHFGFQSGSKAVGHYLGAKA